jgi:hypothetical protein
MTGKGSNDEATDRQLRLLVGLVVVATCLAAGATVVSAWLHPPPAPNPVHLLILAVAVTVAFHFRIRVRIQAGHQATTWAEVPILVGLALFPGVWVVLCVFCGVLAQRLLMKSPLMRKVVTIGKETVGVAAAAAVFAVLGGQPDVAEPPIALLAAAGATIAVAVTEHVVLLPVMAVASGIPYRRLLSRRSW